VLVFHVFFKRVLIVQVNFWDGSGSFVALEIGIGYATFFLRYERMSGVHPPQSAFSLLLLANVLENGVLR